MNDRFEKLKKYNFWGDNMPTTGFIRNEYADKIYSYRGNRLIKVLVGQRRVGKSYILRQLVLKLIESGVDKKNIYFVNRELSDFDFLQKSRSF